MENWPQETFPLDSLDFLAFDFLSIPPVEGFPWLSLFIIIIKLILNAILAQLVEQLFRKQKVKGSMPLIGFFAIQNYNYIII